MDNLLCCFREKGVPSLLGSYRWGPIETRTSSGCPFAAARPCAPHSSCQCPTSPSQICTLLPILLKAAEVPTANPVLSEWSPFADPPEPGRRCWGQQQSGSWSSSAMAGAPACPQPGTPGPAGTRAASQNQGSLTAPLPAWPIGGTALPFSSLAPAWRDEFRSTLGMPLSNICTLDKMLLFLSSLISSSSFNCSLEAFSTLVAGIILSFPWRVHLPLQFTGISLGLDFNFSWDMESHVPQIIPPFPPPSASWVKSWKEKKKSILLSPQKVHPIPLKIDAACTLNSRNKFCRFTSLSFAPPFYH